MLSCRRVLSVLALVGLVVAGLVVVTPALGGSTADAATASAPWWRWWNPARANPSSPTRPTTTTTRPPTTPPTTTQPPTTPSTTTQPPTTPSTTTPPTTTQQTTTPPTTVQPTSPPVSTTPAADVVEFEQRTLALINAERAKVGCSALPGESRLAAAARLHSADMAAKDYFGHTDQSGGSPSDRVRAQGYPTGAAEIIAAGYRTPEDAVTGWMNSPGHKAIITDCRYTEAGAGFARGGSFGFYWTVDFGLA